MTEKNTTEPLFHKLRESCFFFCVYVAIAVLGAIKFDDVSSSENYSGIDVDGQVVYVSRSSVNGFKTHGITVSFCALLLGLSVRSARGSKRCQGVPGSTGLE